MRILGLDYGRKRIGVALSDPLGMTAQPYGYVSQGASFADEIAKIISEQEVTEIVLGLPRNLKGENSEMTHEVEKFGEMLRQRFSLPFHFWDERLTTSESERLLIQANVRREKRKEVRDKIAAALILQGFLDSRGKSK